MRDFILLRSSFSQAKKRFARNVTITPALLSVHIATENKNEFIYAVTPQIIFVIIPLLNAPHQGVNNLRGQLYLFFNQNFFPA